VTIPTTIGASISAGLVAMPRLTDRELDAILDAIDSGDLVAIADPGKTPGSGAIVALADAEHAAKLTDRDDETIADLQRALNNAKRELDSLKTIIGEVFAETEPADHRWKLEEAARDVRDELDYAITTAEEL
jgi:hypothetical protein